MYQQAVEQALQNFPWLYQENDQPVLAPQGGELHSDLPPQPLRSAMRYSLLLHGKRIRPVLLLAAYHLLKEDWRQVMPFACALEMVAFPCAVSARAIRSCSGMRMRWRLGRGRKMCFSHIMASVSRMLFASRRSLSRVPFLLRQSLCVPAKSKAGVCRLAVMRGIATGNHFIKRFFLCLA